jgi:hypothetical protein
VVVCKLAKRGRGACVAGDKCYFKHACNFRYLTSDLTPRRPISRNTNPNAYSRNRFRAYYAHTLAIAHHYTAKFTQAWNPTLGYPGEGPTPVTIATFNARGLVTGGRLRSLLAEARRNRIHVILVQEHNLRGKHRHQVEEASKKFSYVPYVAYLPLHQVRGGAAVFVTKDHPDLDTSSASFTSALHGGAASVRLLQHGLQIRYTSVYVPVMAQLRKVYLERLKDSGLLTADTIVGGDWNCVPDVIVDLQYPENSNTDYPNLHASLAESILASKGLTGARTMPFRIRCP